MSSNPALLSYPALLGGYNRNTLRRWLDLLKLPQLSNLKSDFVEQIAAHLATPEQMQKTLASLRQVERELLEAVQHGRGAIAYDQLVELIDQPGSFGQHYDVGSDDILTIEEMVFVHVDEQGRPAPHGFTEITYDRDRVPARHRASEAEGTSARS